MEISKLHFYKAAYKLYQQTPLKHQIVLMVVFIWFYVKSIRCVLVVVNNHRIYVWLCLLQEYTQEELEKIVYNSREINMSFVNVTYFCVVVFSEIDDISRINKALRLCYDKVEVAYTYNANAMESSTLYIFTCILYIYIMHWTLKNRAIWLGN